MNKKQFDHYVGTGAQFCSPLLKTKKKSSFSEKQFTRYEIRQFFMTAEKKFVFTIK